MNCADCNYDPYFICCGFSMCRLHFAEHFATDGLHNCQKLVNTINPLEKSILEKELASRIESLSRFKTEFIIKISKIIHKLNGFCYDFNKKIDELIQKYLKLSIKNKFATGDLEEIKNITTSEMVLNHLEIDEVCRKIEDICKVDFFGFDNDPQKVKLLRTNKFLQTFNGGLTCLAVSSDKKMIFTGSEDTSLRIWNIETYTQIACMTEHKATVWSVALSYDCAWAATGSLDKSVILWNIQKRRSHQIYTGHSAAVYCISFSNDSKFLISGCAGNQLKLWSTSSPECLKTIPTYSTIWCGLMSSSDNFFYGVGSYLSILSLNSQENIYSIKVHDSSVRSITKSRDDRFFITCSADKTVKIWEMVSMSLYATLSGHSQTVTSVSVTEDNLSILSSSCDDTVIVWSIKTCSKIHQFSFHNSYVYGVVSIDDQIFTVSRDSRIGLASLSSLSFKCFLNKKTFKSSSEVFKDDLVAFGSFTDVVILNVGKNSEEILLKGHEGAVWAVCLSKSFKFALSSSQSVKKNLILWDLKSFSVVAYLNAHQDSVFCVDISADETLALSGDAKSLVVVWDLKTFKVFATFEGHSGFVYSVKFTKDARFAASGGSDKIVLLWNVLEKRIQFRFDGHSQIVWKVLFTDDDKNLVSANCFEGVFVWSVENGRLVFCFKDGVEAKDWVLKNKGIQGELSRFLF